MKHEKSILRSKFRILKKVQKFVLGVQGGRKTFFGVQKVVWNHSGPSRMHYKSFHRKKCFDFFSIFFKHFSKQFCLLLKDLSCISRKKSIFFKNKARMKNPRYRNFYLVTYFTPVTAFDKILKIEGQVKCRS